MKGTQVTQLWMWEYEGKTYYGFDCGTYLKVLSRLGSFTDYTIPKSRVTNLRRSIDTRQQEDH